MYANCFTLLCSRSKIESLVNTMTCVFIHSANLCLIGEFNPFPLKVITDKGGCCHVTSVMSVNICYFVSVICFNLLFVYTL